MFFSMTWLDKTLQKEIFNKMYNLQCLIVKHFGNNIMELKDLQE